MKPFTNPFATFAAVLFAAFSAGCASTQPQAVAVDRPPQTYAIILFLADDEAVDAETRDYAMTFARDTLLAAGLVTPNDTMITDPERAQMLFRARLENGQLVEIAGVPAVTQGRTVVLSAPRRDLDRIWWNASYPNGYPDYYYDSFYGDYPVPGPGWGYPSRSNRGGHGNRTDRDKDRDKDKDKDKDYPGPRPNPNPNRPDRGDNIVTIPIERPDPSRRRDDAVGPRPKPATEVVKSTPAPLPAPYMNRAFTNENGRSVGPRERANRPVESRPTPTVTPTPAPVRSTPTPAPAPPPKIEPIPRTTDSSSSNANSNNSSNANTQNSNNRERAPSRDREN